MLPLAESYAEGVAFVTGREVTFHFVRNTEKSPYLGARFGQDIEPAGRYILHNPDPGDLPPRWESGIVTLCSPLVMPLVVGGRDEPIYGPNGWKALLYAHFGKKGRALSKALVKQGYDSVVTVDLDGYTREIVVLVEGRCR